LLDGRFLGRRPSRGLDRSLVGLGGLLWAVLQPYRVTVLDPEGQGFWWLFVEPPLLVILVGVLFAWLVAPGLIRDLEEQER